jgi:small subunit ribosomal protein S3
MGQKTHPLGFRLGITQEYNSIWYAKFNQYPQLLKEDNKIRNYLTKLPKINSISNIHIDRDTLNNHILLDIETGKPGILAGEFGKDFKSLVYNIKRLLPDGRKLTINVSEVKEIDLNANLLGDLIVEKLEKRITFRRVIKEALERSRKKNVKGIKIQVSGRLNGADIARSEWIREGRVPLQTLRARIDYATKEAYTIYGVLGVKVWLFKNEILTK